MTIALPPPEDRAFADVWTALGGELKPSLDVVVSTPLLSGQATPAGPPAREGVQIDVADLTGEAGDSDRDGHRPDADPAGDGRVAMRRATGS
jgi:hypothetical protein